MNKTQVFTLSVGLALASWLTGLGNGAEAASPETSPAITIHVHNYAGVSTKTMGEAEEVATEIFGKTGVEVRWTDSVLTTATGQQNTADPPPCTLADIQVSVFPRQMSDRDGAPNNAMGLAPGNGPDRQIVYIFESNVEDRYWRVMRAQGSAHVTVSGAQILGHAIAHEIGHVLLNQQVHSAQGIMRGEWACADFRDIAEGTLCFTPQQEESLRAEVRRRNMR
jgi:hypothetical protein